MPPRKAFKPVKPQFSIRLRKSAVQQYITAYNQIHGKTLTSVPLPTLQRGCKGDPVVHAAYKSFMSIHARDTQLKDLNRECGRTKYIYLHRKHFDEFIVHRKCTRKGRKKPVNLADAEGQRLAELVSTHVKEGN